MSRQIIQIYENIEKWPKRTTNICPGDAWVHGYFGILWFWKSADTHTLPG